MKKILILFFITSCVSPNSNVNHNNKKYNFSEDLSFNEFKHLLNKYSETNLYPNID